MAAKVLQFHGLKVANTKKPMAKKKYKKTESQKLSGPVRSMDVPATKGMLVEFRDELKHLITQSEMKLRAELKAQTSSVNTEISGIKAELIGLRADIEKVLATVHNIALLMEEQNARNIYVLDGHTNLHDRVTKIEKKVFKDS